MNFDKKVYKKYAEARAKKSNTPVNCMRAFAVGGLICVLAQIIKDVLKNWLDSEQAATVTSVIMIFIAALLTGLGVFDKIAKYAGAGTLVPITGFSNAMTAAAIDAKDEGLVLGVGAKIFTVAGPVILYGVAAGVVYGVIYWVTTLF